MVDGPRGLAPITWKYEELIEVCAWVKNTNSKSNPVNLFLNGIKKIEIKKTTIHAAGCSE
jgi:hypothetical protein